MSTMQNVRDAEKKVQEILAALKQIGANDKENLSGQLARATDDYAKAVRELEWS